MTEFQEMLCNYFVGKKLIDNVEYNKREINILFHEPESLEIKQVITIYEPSLDFVEKIYNSDNPQVKELDKKAQEYARTVHRYRVAQGESEQMGDVAEAWIKGYKYLAKEIEKDGVVPQLYMDETIRQNLALKREIEKLKKSK